MKSTRNLLGGLLSLVVVGVILVLLVLIFRGQGGQPQVAQQPYPVATATAPALPLPTTPTPGAYPAPQTPTRIPPTTPTALPLPTETPEPTATAVVIPPTPFIPPTPLPKSFRQVIFAVQPPAQPFSLWKLDHDVATGLVAESQLIAPDLGDYGLWKVFNLSVSPHQRYVAINARTWEGGGSIVWIINIDGSRVAQVGIPEHEFETVFLDWLPGTDQVLLSAGLGYLTAITTIEGNVRRTLPLHMIADGAVSPDGRRIVVSGTEENAFWLMNVDGSGIEKIPVPDKARGGAAPDDIAWSPDGKQTSYVDHLANEMQQICVVDADGKNPKCLSSSDAHNISPAWSPDGMSLVYVREESRGIVRREPNTWTSSIWVVDVASDTSRELVKSAGRSHWAPTWLPDGSAILFISNRGGADDVWIINADGTRLQQLTFHGHVTGGLAMMR